MNFFNQYKDMFQVGKIGFVPSQRLKLDNQLFIDRPYVPAYTQEYSLNSKLRQLKRDYNDFQSQVKWLQQLQNAPQKADSRVKEFKRQQRQPGAKLLQSKLRNHYSYKKTQSNVFSHLNQNIQNINQKARNLQNYSNKFKDNSMQRNSINKKPQGFNKNGMISSSQMYQQQKYSPQRRQKQNNQYNKSGLNRNSYEQQYKKQSYNNVNTESPQKKYLQGLRKQNDQYTQKLVKNQNILKNKFYDQQNNNVLKQSQINHVFNWKLQKLSSYDKLQNIPETTIPKYKIQNSSLDYPQNDRSGNSYNNGKNFMIRNRSNNQIKPNNRDKIVPPQRQHNKMNKNSEAMERRRIAKVNIDQRRQKLKNVIRSYY